MKDITLNILCHADFSGRIRRKKDSVGFCSFSGEIDNLRKEYPDTTILLDAGDSFNTTFWGGLPMVGAANLNGTDVMCLGNHEFDNGYVSLKESIDHCAFPILCANIKEKETDKLIYKTEPTLIIEKQGIKIGIVGLTTEYTPYMVEKSAFLPFKTESAIDAANSYIPKLKAAGAEVVIALTHIPFYQSEEGELSGELIDLIEGSPKADVWIGGHIPGDCAKIVDGSCVVKAGFGGNSIGQIKIYLDGETHKIISKECKIVHTKADNVPRPEVKAYIEKIVKPYESYFSEKLSVAKEEWKMTLARESKLGDYLVDCLRFGGKTQLAYMNATSCCGKIEPGTVTRDTITDVAGFNDKIFVGEISGAQIKELMELVYQPERFGNNAAMLISGFHVEVDHTQSWPNKVKAVTLPGGGNLDPDRLYTVTTSAYMASGGNDTEKITSQIKWKEVDKHFYDIIFEYTKHMDVLKVEDFPRIIEKGEPENNNAPY